jgi:GNAT superfamily N-acetyltransferase
LNIINATWEKRNLDVVAIEANLDGSESPADLERIRDLNCEYAVVRCPAGAIELMFKIEDMGYYYIESMLDVRHDLKNIGTTLDRVSRRIADSVSYAEMNAAEIEELWAQLRLGIFDTDRIYVDPAFTPDKSANRYVGWLGDELGRGGKIFKCVLNEKTAGYFCTRFDDNGVAHIVSVGTYKDFQTAGLGISFVNASLKQAVEAGAKLAHGGVSSNNMPSLKAHLAAGYLITSAQYIYIKHDTKK